MVELSGFPEYTVSLCSSELQKMEKLLVEFVLNRRWGDQKEEKDLQGLNSAVDVVLILWFLESWNSLRAVLAADTEVWL